MDMWTKGYDDAWDSKAAEFTDDEEYMEGYQTGEYDMAYQEEFDEEDDFDDEEDELVTA
jgi:hypothetical protein